MPTYFVVLFLSFWFGNIILLTLIPYFFYNDAEEADDNFHCDICDFKSNWANGLRTHMTRKHASIEQLDGSDSATDDLEILDRKYKNTEHYWAEGRIGRVYQAFLDANDIIENSDLNEEGKAIERFKLLEARKCSFGGSYKHFPPWI